LNEGHLGLIDRYGQHVPEIYDWRRISVEHLLFTLDTEFFTSEPKKLLVPPRYVNGIPFQAYLTNYEEIHGYNEGYKEYLRLIGVENVEEEYQKWLDAEIQSKENSP